MSDTTPRSQILKNIRKALVNPVPMPFPDVEGNSSNVYTKPEDNIIHFIEQFKNLGGMFHFSDTKTDCYNEINSLINQKKWKKVVCWEENIFNPMIFSNVQNISNSKDLQDIDASITGCEALLSRTGSVLLSSKQASGRSLGAYAPAHIVVASIHQIVEDINDGVKYIQMQYANNIPSMICLTTGPSRTADIEKTLVVGVHGPKEIYVFLTEEK